MGTPIIKMRRSYLYNGNSYADNKAASLYWDIPQKITEYLDICWYLSALRRQDISNQDINHAV